MWYTYYIFYAGRIIMDRKVILYIAISLDGFIADINGGIDWLGGQYSSYNGDYGYSNFIKNIDTVVMGMNTYKQIVKELSPNKWPYSDIKSYVFTSKKMISSENIIFVNQDIKSFILDLKNKKGRDIWINGGANIANQLIKDDIIDEYNLSIMPIILGQGIPLFNIVYKKLKLDKYSEENGVLNIIYSRRVNI